MSVSEVLAGKRPWWCEAADCVEWLAALPEDSLDLCFFSPPYEKARTYGIDFNLAGQDWVDWMVKVFEGCRRACKGLVACVCEGQTKNYRWSAAPVLLLADLHRRGFNLRKPPLYRRYGICGSGGPDWLRNDYEFIVCTSRPGRLPWSENTALGRPPKYAPGGAMSHRLPNGLRKGERWQKHCTQGAPKGGEKVRTVKRGYKAPDLANPGNVIDCKVGGGRMGEGDSYSRENEAPFPEPLAEFFVRSFCPPGGVVCDCFSGSGTTAAVSVRWGRRFVGCDVRQSQVDLTRRRVEGETPLALFGG